MTGWGGSSQRLFDVLSDRDSKKKKKKKKKIFGTPPKFPECEPNEYNQLRLLNTVQAREEETQQRKGFLTNAMICRQKRKKKVAKSEKQIKTQKKKTQTHKSVGDPLTKRRPKGRRAASPEGNCSLASG